MEWLYLGIAVMFEIAVAMSANNAKGFTHVGWTVATFFLSRALLTFDVGVGYAIWVATAAVGIVILGVLFLRQRLTWQKLAGIVIVVVGVVGLRLSGAA